MIIFYSLFIYFFLLDEFLTSECHKSFTVFENYFLFKIDNSHFTQRFCQIKAQHPIIYPHTLACMQLLYLSYDHNCDILVTLGQQAEKGVNMTIPLGTHQHLPPALCTKFNSNQGLVILSVYKSSSVCQGKFVISFNLTQVQPSSSKFFITSVNISDMIAWGFHIQKCKTPPNITVEIMIKLRDCVMFISFIFFFLNYWFSLFPSFICMLSGLIYFAWIEWALLCIKLIFIDQFHYGSLSI